MNNHQERNKLNKIRGLLFINKVSTLMREMHGAGTQAPSVLWLCLPLSFDWTFMLPSFLFSCQEGVGPYMVHSSIQWHPWSFWHPSPIPLTIQTLPTQLQGKLEEIIFLMLMSSFRHRRIFLLFCFLLFT